MAFDGSLGKASSTVFSSPASSGIVSVVSSGWLMLSTMRTRFFSSRARDRSGLDSVTASVACCGVCVLISVFALRSLFSLLLGSKEVSENSAFGVSAFGEGGGVNSSPLESVSTPGGAFIVRLCGKLVCIVQIWYRIKGAKG
jgi:hypothetical protein